MRLYETTFLIAPNLSEEETDNIIQDMSETVSQKKGKMVNVDKWGKRKLAYPIQKFDAAFYVFFLYEGEAEIPMELERRFKQSEVILRYLTVKHEETEKPRRKRKKEKTPAVETARERTARAPVREKPDAAKSEEKSEATEPDESKKEEKE